MEQTPTQAMREGKAWVESNLGTYNSIVSWAMQDAMLNPGRDLRIAGYCEMARMEGVHIPNAVRAYLARRIEKELRGKGYQARFAKAKSKIDMFMEGK